MSSHQQTAENAGVIAAKLAPPASVSIATLFGLPVNELLLWATLVYTVLLIGHKLYAIYRDVKS